MTLLADLKIGQATDVGLARSLNQDYVSCFVPEDEIQCQDKGALFLVADGMGGHNAGEVASQEAVKCVRGVYYADTDRGVKENLREAFGVANRLLCDLAEADPAKVGMGTTLVAAVIRGHKATIANVGDSRAYLLRRKRFTQITVDHSWVEEQVRAGLLTPEQARRHPHRNLITRALGTRPGVEVDVFDVHLCRGDLLLLCTDGLSSQVSEQDLARILDSTPPREAAESLVARANGEGGIDNVSAVILQAGDRPAKGDFVPLFDGWQSRAAQGRLAVGLMALLILCLFALVLSFPVAGP
jgi:serine/threonine protein phosphatase PrpC